MTEQIQDLSGMQKAAILLISLGAEVCAQVFKNFDEDTVENLTKEIIKMRDVHPIVSEAEESQSDLELFKTGARKGSTVIQEDDSSEIDEIFAQ